MIGHRERLWTKLQQDCDISDLDLIEMILFLIIPRKDTKILAIDLKKNSNSLNDLFSNILQYSDNNKIIRIFKLIYTLNLRLNKEKIYNKSLTNNFQDLIAFLKILLCEKNSEEFYVIFMDNRNNVKKIENVFSGSVEDIHIYPKEIFRKCLLYGLYKIILVHNHPSCNPNPSNNDITITNHIKKSALIIDIELVDHIIIAGDNYFSFKHNLLI